MTQTMPELDTIYQGEALALLQSWPGGFADAVITDPPYSSGGFTRDDKGKEVGEKYQEHGTVRKYPSFAGDSRDQRSYLAWCALWITECARLLRGGGYFLAFTDWRQLPVMTDAVQAGGIFWRGLIAWDKGAGARAPHKGYFRHQCEYIVWGTKGPARILEHDGPFPGLLQAVVRQDDKFHLTGKPTAIMKDLVRVVEPGGVVVDPFAGSGTTAVAAYEMGRRYVAIEREPEYIAIAQDRIRNTKRQGGLLGPTLEQGRLI